jgi:hypothetical protein
MEDVFTCAQCGLTFIKGRSDEESIQQTIERGDSLDDLVVVCDDCFMKIRPDLFRDGKYVGVTSNQVTKDLN